MNCRLGSLAKASLEEKIELLEKYPWSSYQSYMYGTGVRPVEDREAYLVKREASEKEKECRLTIEKEEAKKAEKNLIERD